MRKPVTTVLVMDVSLGGSLQKFTQQGPDRYMNVRKYEEDSPINAVYVGRATMVDKIMEHDGRIVVRETEDEKSVELL